MADKTIFRGELTDTCARCRFFDIITNIEQRTQLTVCRRNGPQAFAQAGMAADANGQPVIQWQQCTLWPIVQATDWCGDFARKLQS